MSKTTRELLKQMEAIQKTLEQLQATEQSTMDATKDFADTEVMSKRAYIEAAKKTAMLEKNKQDAQDASDNNNDIIDIEELYKLNFPNNRSFMGQGGQKINQECEWGVQSCRLLTDKKSKISVYKLRIIKEGIKYSIMFGSGAIYGDKKEETYKTGRIVEVNGEKIKIQETRYTTQPEMIFNGQGDIKTNDKDNIKEIKKQDCVVLTIRDTGIGDIVWTMPLLPMQIYADWLINNNAANCVTKAIMVVKDGSQSDKEIRRFRAPNSPVLRQIADNQTNEPINNILEKKMGETVSKQLLDLIQGKKGLDETYDKFMGKPSTSASQSKVSGEFIAGQANAVYLADYRYERIADAILEFNWKFTEKINIDEQSSPLVKFWDINGEEQDNNENYENNDNAVKNGETRDTIAPENGGGE